jgi:hypothetical protein
MTNTSLYRKLFVGAAAVALGVSAVGVKLAFAADETELQGIMKNGFNSTAAKPSILKKATTGKATPDELKTLLDYVQKMQKATPPKGDQKDWDTRTAAILKATEAVIKGEDKTAPKTLETATTCKDCHSLHRPPKPPGA